MVAVDLPGIDRAKLDISIDGDNRLTIKGERAARESTQHRGECPSGKFLRTFSVPASVDQKDIRANYKDGVLEVHCQSDLSGNRSGSKSRFLSCKANCQFAVVRYHYRSDRNGYNKA